METKDPLAVPVFEVAGPIQSHLPVAQQDLPSLLEALLLVSPEPAAIQDLARAAGVPAQVVDLALDQMAGFQDRGWTVIRHNDTAHLSTAPRWAEYVRNFLRIE